MRSWALNSPPPTANGMAAEVAVRRGISTVVLDVRRGDGPRGAFDFTFSALAATEQLVRDSPETAAAAVRESRRARPSAVLPLA